MEKPFRSSGSWYRGNLHMHSTASDGKPAPEEAVDFYRQRGYDFIALTDHRATTDVPQSDPDDGFLLLNGLELDCWDPDREVGYHIVGIGAEAFSQAEALRTGPGQALVDAIRDHGGEAFLAHPYWLGQELADLEAVSGAFGMEVYNATCALVGKGDGRIHWDGMLDRGHRLWALATDDAHHYDVDGEKAWIMVRAEALTRDAILDALRTGSFYATQGPFLADARVTAGQVRVHTSPVAEIRFISNRGRGRVLRAVPGQSLTAGSCPAPNEGYVRVEAVDAEGRRAWSQPAFFPRSESS